MIERKNSLLYLFALTWMRVLWRRTRIHRSRPYRAVRQLKEFPWWLSNWRTSLRLKRRKTCFYLSIVFTVLFTRRDSLPVSTVVYIPRIETTTAFAREQNLLGISSLSGVCTRSTICQRTSFFPPRRVTVCINLVFLVKNKLCRICVNTGSSRNPQKIDHCRCSILVRRM